MPSRRVSNLRHARSGVRQPVIRARDGRDIKLPDALIIATAIVLGADRIVTADAGWPAQGVPVMVLGTA